MPAGIVQTQQSAHRGSPPPLRLSATLEVGSCLACCATTDLRPQPPLWLPLNRRCRRVPMPTPACSGPAAVRGSGVRLPPVRCPAPPLPALQRHNVLVGGCCCCRWLSCPSSCCAALLECERAPASRARMGAAAATAAAITSRPEKGLAPLCSPHIEALASNAAAEPASLPPAPLALCAGLCCACQTPRAPPQPSWQARRVAQCQWQVRSVVCGLQSSLCRACQAHPTPPPGVQQLALSRVAGGAWQVTMRLSTVFISALPPPHAVPLPSTPLPPPTYPPACPPGQTAACLQSSVTSLQIPPRKA